MNQIKADHIFSVNNSHDFSELAMDIFHFQAVNCTVYANFIKNLGLRAEAIKEVSGIPFLPIEFFKNHSVMSVEMSPEMIFTSSGTTGSIQSKHPVAKLSLYEQSFKTAFARFYGNISELTVLALLPSYLEREGSSLIYMVDTLIRESRHPESGYFLHNYEDLYKILELQKRQRRKTLLIGVTYALLNFTEQFQIHFPDLIVMETGGMKGKRPEILREELHEILKSGFGVPVIHSEYGMTELLSQAYSKGNGLFECPPWMKVLIRDTNDPLTLLDEGKTGGLNIIDLANLNSCSFIATQDLGKVHGDAQFEVLGRFDNSDLRGCNLLVQ